MQESKQFTVAIIGGGLSGLSLALALHQQKIACTVYEGRGASYDIGGGMMLMCNGLKVLQALGIESQIRELGFSFEKVNLQLAQTGAILETFDFGNQQVYGFKALRIYRSTLLEELLRAVRQRGIPIHFNRKYHKVIAEDGEQVEIAFTDGSSAKASLLVGADGIRSSVRSYLYPEIKPIFQGGASIFGTVPLAELGLATEDLQDITCQTNKWPLPCGIVHPSYGATVLAPQTPSGKEVLVAVQRHFALDTDETYFRKLREDKDDLIKMIRQNSEHFPDIVQNAVKKMDKNSIIVWPFYLIPELKSWSSDYGRVVILGDSAHALPPSGGQGLNQALEDVCTLAMTLARLSPYETSDIRKVLPEAIGRWQKYRQTRINHVLELNRQMDFRRMPLPPGTSTEEIDKRKKPLDYDTVWNVDFQTAVSAYLEGLEIKSI